MLGFALLRHLVVHRLPTPYRSNRRSGTGNGSKRWHNDHVPASSRPGSSAASPRFLTLADVAEVLATSVAQVRALVQSGELRSIQIGGRQQYRVETAELEDYIQRMYAKAEQSRQRRSADREPAEGG